MLAFAISLLLAQVPMPSPAPTPTAPAASNELFTKNKCTACHGEDGKGQTEKGRKLKAPDFTDPKFQKETTDVEMARSIRNGVKNKAGKLLMPAFKAKLSPGDVRALVAYVRSFATKAERGPAH